MNIGELYEHGLSVIETHYASNVVLKSRNKGETAVHYGFLVLSAVHVRSSSVTEVLCESCYLLLSRARKRKLFEITRVAVKSRTFLNNTPILHCVTSGSMFCILSIYEHIKWPL